MNCLLIDIGNTRTKLALSQGSQIVDRRHLSTNLLDAERLRLATTDWQFDHTVLCSVVPHQDEHVREFAPNLVSVTYETDLGIGIDYPEPATIGADRIANAVALASLYGAPGVAIDLGTALTFDLVSAEGNYIGGIIAPGLEMMSDYLAGRTALLSEIDVLEKPPVIGKSTRQAMQSGAYYGYVGMIREILQEVLRSMGSPKTVAVVATGGSSEMFARALPAIGLCEPDLTLHGLRIIAERNFHPD